MPVKMIKKIDGGSIQGYNLCEQEHKRNILVVS